MSVFSSDAFLETVKDTYFSNDTARIGLVNIEGQRYKTLIVQGEKPVSAIPFMDYICPLAEGEAPAGELAEITSNRIRKVVLAEGELRSTEHTEYLVSSLKASQTTQHPEGFHPGAVISPAIRLDRIADFETYKDECRKRASRTFSKRALKKLHKLETESAAIEAVFEVDKPRQSRVLDDLLAWKEQQYIRTDVPNLFAIEAHRNFLKNLLAREILVLSAIFLGGKTIAAHAGFIHEGTFYYVLPSYDSAYKSGSPGLFLMEYMIEQSHAKGLTEFDFLLGDEAYKFYYSDYYRIVGMAGETDQWECLRRNSKEWLKKVLFKNEKIKGVVKSYMRSRRQRGA